MTHLALLRGINVGGHKKEPMADLRKAFSEMGFSNVQTLLASGNVLFEAEAADPDLEDGAEDWGEGRSGRVKMNFCRFDGFGGFVRVLCFIDFYKLFY